MNYQVVKFEYKHFSYSKAEVVHWPNWFERLLRKRAVVVQYIGWVDFWLNAETFERAPYDVKCDLTAHWHDADLHDFKMRGGIVSRAFDATTKFLKRHADNN